MKSNKSKQATPAFPFPGTRLVFKDLACPHCGIGYAMESFNGTGVIKIEMPCYACGKPMVFKSVAEETKP